MPATGERGCRSKGLVDCLCTESVRYRLSLAAAWARDTGPEQPGSSRWGQEKFSGSQSPPDSGSLSDVCSSLHQGSSWSQLPLLLYYPDLRAVMMPSLS